MIATGDSQQNVKTSSLGDFVAVNLHGRRTQSFKILNFAMFIGQATEFPNISSDLSYILTVKRQMRFYFAQSFSACLTEMRHGSI